MSQFAIVGDSTCDLTKKLRTEYDVDYCFMSVSYKDGKEEKEILANLDWEIIPAKKYFDMMREGTRFLTAQVSEAEFDRVIGGYLKKGIDVLYIACSSALSQSVNLARKLNEDVWKKEYPNNKVVIIDSLISCMGQGMILMEASRLRKEGKTIDEVAKIIEDTKLDYNQIAVCNTLTYLARAGRVKGAKAFFGNLAGVKPIFISDAKGNNFAVEKVKGRRSSLLKVVEMTKNLAVKPEEQVCYLSHADALEEDINFLKEHLLNEVGFKDVCVSYLGPIIGASTGPETIGVYFVGKTVTIGA